MRITVALSVTFLLTIGSCTTDGPTAPASSDLASRVRLLGFDPEGMEDHGGYVVVEGDIRLDKQSLLQSASGKKGAGAPPSRQYNTTHIVSGTNIGQITVDLSGIAGVSDWADAARDAIAAYNATGTRIHMSEASPGDITFGSISQFENPGVIAQGAFPAWAYEPGKPGSTITIARNFDGLSRGQKEKVLAHEFGHNIGLRHDNAVALEGTGDVGAELITGTQTSDPSSIMVRVFDGGEFNGFSQGDLIALNNLYSILRASIEAPYLVGSNITCRFDAIVSGGTPPYTVDWSISEPSMGFYPWTGSGTTFVTHNNQRVQQTFYVSITVHDATGASLFRSLTGPVAAEYGGYDATRCWSPY